MRTSLTLVAASLLAAACSTTSDGVAGSEKRVTAVSNLSPTQGNQARGQVKFTELSNNKVRVEATVTGLTPGLHGFHIHEKGDCSAPDAMSAGGHFNPTGKPHGGSAGVSRHAGDIGNLNADAAGKAVLTVDVEDIDLVDPAGNIIGRAVVVHANPDDTTSQPAGNSGGRVACGVIAKG